MLKFFLEHVWEVSIAGVVLLSAIYYFLCARTITALNTELKKILGAPGVDEALSKSELLKPAWTAFEKTLTKAKDGKVYSTADASEFFNVTSLTRGMNMTFWQGYGGIFTGLGILGTFAGLTGGLNGVDMTSGELDTLKGSIANLLSGVESAFVTSLVGIGCALVYSGVHQALLVRFQKNVRRLADKLDENFPRRSIEDWLAEGHAEAQAQSTTLQSINGQVATENAWLEKNHGEAQAQTTALQSIDTNVDSQKAILQNIGEDVARAIYEGLDNRMDAAVENLCNKLEEKLLPQTDRICGSIEKLDANLSTAIGKIDPAVDRICAAIDKLGKDAAEGLNDTMSKVAGAQMERFSAALDRFSDSLDKKLEAANEIAKIMNEQLLNTLKDLNDALKQHADASAAERAEVNKKFLAALQNLIDTLNEVAKKNKEAGDAAHKQATEDREHFQKQNREDRNQFLALLADLIKTMNEVADKFKTQGDKQQKLLDTIASSNAAQIGEAVKAFRAIVDTHNEATAKTFRQVQNLLTETKTFLNNIDEASRSFKTAADPVKQTTLQLTQNLSDTSTQIGRLAAANQTTRQTLDDLSTRLADFVKNFNGIAKELESSTDIIGKSLDNYNIKTSKELSDALTDFGNEMTKALGGLEQIVNDFSDTVGYVKQRQQRR